jgi:hypothetical protein
MMHTETFAAIAIAAVVPFLAWSEVLSRQSDRRAEERRSDFRYRLAVRRRRHRLEHEAWMENHARLVERWGQ